LGGGGTVLLHDSDVAAAPGAWKSTLGALPRLLDECDRRGWSVGPLVDHHTGRPAAPVVAPAPPAAPAWPDRDVDGTGR
jgi:hypothetical protein